VKHPIKQEHTGSQHDFLIHCQHCTLARLHPVTSSKATEDNMRAEDGLPFLEDILFAMSQL